MEPTLARFSVFASDRRGAVAILFALTLIPALGLVGAAVDYARAYSAQTKLQGALDAAVLAAGASAAMAEDERIDYAKQVFAANFPQGESGITATPHILIGNDGIIKGSVEAKIDAAIIGILGIDKLSVGANSQARLANRLTAEIALVLDYSGSMDRRNKYQAMRDAAISLVESLAAKGSEERAKFALIPFSGEVYATLPKGYVYGQSGPGSWTGCTADRKHPFNVTDATPNPADDASKWGPHCPPGSNQGNRQCPPPSCNEYHARSLVVRPLTNDHSAVIQQLRAMRPWRYTHISLGLEFGWHAISPAPPWSEGAAYDGEGVLKAIVLLTDGEQTSPGWGPGESHNVRQAEHNLEEMCETIKARGVILITVGFDLDHQQTLNRLRSCATSPSHFFDARTNADLAQAFQTITARLENQLHLTR